MKSIITVPLVCCFLCITPFYLSAQTAEESTTPSFEHTSGFERPVISAEEYILMPGDSVLVTITGATNYSYITAITLEGKITINIPVTPVMTPPSQAIERTPTAQYYIVDAVPIYNLSLNAAKDSLNNVFLKYFRGINVDITLLSMRTFLVFVAGEVNRPGITHARPVNRVSTIIDSVGGITAIGSRSRIELRRGGTFYKRVDLEEFKRTGNTEVNPYVQDGDVIYVPRMEKSVIIIGAVLGKREYEIAPSALMTAKPTPVSAVLEFTAFEAQTGEGMYELLDGETVSDVIAKTIVAPWADLTSVYIERKGEKIDINLAEVLAHEQSENDIVMQDGDVLYVPAIHAVVYVEGQVVNPGTFRFQPNMRAKDYIGFAGGPRDAANTSWTFVQRGRKRIWVNKSNPLIEEGDKIVVPRQIFKFWQDYLQIGAVVASLLISYLTLTQ